jgi:pimeloyl-ACP methyl ester carboxylesterase
VTIPTLVIVGDADIICPPRLSRPIVEAMPHAELAVIPGAAHQPFQEKPDEYNSIVAGFWARADRSVRIAAAA